jgi:hypothetical protein
VFVSGAARDRLKNALFRVADHEAPHIPTLPKAFEHYRYQPPRVLDEISQDGKRFRGQQNSFVGLAIRATPEAFVDDVEPERRELFHRSEVRRALAAMRSAVPNPSVKRR